jgi:hypothetical protein
MYVINETILFTSGEVNILGPRERKKLVLKNGTFSCDS